MAVIMDRGGDVLQITGADLSSRPCHFAQGQMRIIHTGFIGWCSSTDKQGVEHSPLGTVVQSNTQDLIVPVNSFIAMKHTILYTCTSTIPRNETSGTSKLYLKTKFHLPRNRASHIWTLYQETKHYDCVSSAVTVAHLVMKSLLFAQGSSVVRIPVMTDLSR